MLIVEDNPAVRSLVGRTLIQGGYEVLEADGVHSTRRLLAAFAVTLAIVDLHLSGEDGLALMHEIRQVQPQVPLIAMSGRIDVELCDLLAAARLRDHVWPLSKPFTPTELLGTVYRALAA
ncbi:MAG TPA: response regulator [Gemmatimonadales bacterium]|nr:response regulator [Gemmatimonadales bacterium]